MAASQRPGERIQAGRVFTDIAGRAFIRLPLVVAGALLALLLIAGLALALARKSRWASRCCSPPA